MTRKLEEVLQRFEERLDLVEARLAIADAPRPPPFDMPPDDMFDAVAWFQDCDVSMDVRMGAEKLLRDLCALSTRTVAWFAQSWGSNHAGKRVYTARWVSPQKKEYYLNALPEGAEILFVGSCVGDTGFLEFRGEAAVRASFSEFVDAPQDKVAEQSTAKAVESNAYGVLHASPGAVGLYGYDTGLYTQIMSTLLPLLRDYPATRTAVIPEVYCQEPRSACLVWHTTFSTLRVQVLRAPHRKYSWRGGVLQSAAARELSGRSEVLREIKNFLVSAAAL